MNFVEVLIRRGSERAREIYKNLRTLWYGRWRDEVVEFRNYNGGGTNVIMREQGDREASWDSMEAGHEASTRWSLWFLHSIGRWRMLHS